MTLDQMLYRASENAEQIFTEFQHVNPAFIAETATRQITPLILSDMPTDSDGKELVYSTIREIFNQIGAVRFVSIAEAWILFPQPGETYTGKPLAEHLDRREVVFIHAEDIQGNIRSAIHYILRPEHNKATLSPLHELPIGQSSGRMTELLHPPAKSTRH